MKRLVYSIIIITTLSLFSSCSKKDEKLLTEKSSATAYLYGETHGVAKIYEKEFELWNDFYHNNEMRNLFVELPYYAAEYLNIWMGEEDDKILEQLSIDYRGTQGFNQDFTNMLKKIKADCPKTIFHGIDVGHAYNVTGERYLKHLETSNLKESEEYNLTLAAIEQGKKYYNNFKGPNNDYREDKLVSNFIREFNKLKDKDIMGIFGSAHTDFNSFITNKTKNMATQLKEYYGDQIISENLSYLLLVTEPIRTDKITLNGKDYDADYYGSQDLSEVFKDFLKRDYWHLKDAYSDFSSHGTTGNNLPFGNYIMKIKENEIYVIDYTKKDGTVLREIHKNNGTKFNGQESTQELIIK